jgi:hypothetical protein
VFVVLTASNALGNRAPVLFLTVADPAAFGADPCYLQARCGLGSMALTVAGQPTTVPVFVDPTAADETARGALAHVLQDSDRICRAATPGISIPKLPPKPKKR